MSATLLAVVPIYFQQLREMRNGSATLPDLVKRYRMQPPLRSVLKKLNVNNLTEVQTEVELYDAVLWCVQNQAAEDGGSLEGEPEGRVIRNGNPRPQPNDEEYFEEFDDDEVDESSSAIKSWEETTTPSLPTDLEFVPEYVALVKCVMTARATWSRNKRTHVLSRESGLKPKFITSAFAKINKILGCRQLHPEINLDRCIAAVTTYFRQNHTKPAQSLTNGIDTLSITDPSEIFSGSSESSTMVYVQGKWVPRESCNAFWKDISRLGKQGAEIKWQSFELDLDGNSFPSLESKSSGGGGSISPDNSGAQSPPKNSTLFGAPGSGSTSGAQGGGKMNPSLSLQPIDNYSQSAHQQLPSPMSGAGMPQFPRSSAAAASVRPGLSTVPVPGAGPDSRRSLSSGLGGRSQSNPTLSQIPSNSPQISAPVAAAIIANDPFPYFDPKVGFIQSNRPHASVLGNSSPLSLQMSSSAATGSGAESFVPPPVLSISASAVSYVPASAGTGGAVMGGRTQGTLTPRDGTFKPSQVQSFQQQQSPRDGNSLSAFSKPNLLRTDSREGLDSGDYRASPKASEPGTPQTKNYARAGSVSSLSNLTQRAPNMSPLHQFWDASLRLFQCICDHKTSCALAVNMFSELCDVVFSSPSLTAASLVALDIVAQVAMSTLSDKIHSSVVPAAAPGASDLVFVPVPVSASKTLESCSAALNAMAAQREVALAEAVNSGNIPKDGTKFASNKLAEVLQQQLWWCCGKKDLHDPLEGKEFGSQRARFCDDLFASLVNKERSALPPTTPAPGEGLNTISYRLQLALASQGVSVKLCGAAGMEVMGFFHGAGVTCSTEAVVDLLATSAELEHQEEECRAAARTLNREIKTLEMTLAEEMEQVASLKHCQFCVEELRKYLAEVKAQMFESSSEADSAQAVAMTQHLAKIGADGTMLCRQGERFIDEEKLGWATTQGQQLGAKLDRLVKLKAEAKNAMNEVDMLRAHRLSEVCGTVSSAGHRDKGFSHVAGHDKCIQFYCKVEDMRPAGLTLTDVQCNLVVGCSLHECRSRLLRCYLRLDASGKVNCFIAAVRLFVKCHGLSTELSSYAWAVLAVHMLLRFGYLPNIQQNFNQALTNKDGARIDRRYCVGVDVTFIEGAELPPACVEKLARTSVFELLHTFCRYLSAQCDMISNVFTMRGRGEVILKQIWGEVKENVLWRISIEDPFECSGTYRPCDLGRNVTRTGQIHMMKTLRLATCALAGMAFLDGDIIEISIRHLYSPRSLERLAMDMAANTASPLTTNGALGDAESGGVLGQSTFGQGSRGRQGGWGGRDAGEEEDSIGRQRAALEVEDSIGQTLSYLRGGEGSGGRGHPQGDKHLEEAGLFESSSMDGASDFWAPLPSLAELGGEGGSGTLRGSTSTFGGPHFGISDGEGASFGDAAFLGDGLSLGAPEFGFTHRFSSGTGGMGGGNNSHTGSASLRGDWLSGFDDVSSVPQHPHAQAIPVQDHYSLMYQEQHHQSHYQQQQQLQLQYQQQQEHHYQQQLLYQQQQQAMEQQRLQQQLMQQHDPRRAPETDPAASSPQHRPEFSDIIGLLVAEAGTGAPGGPEHGAPAPTPVVAPPVSAPPPPPVPESAASVVARGIAQAQAQAQSLQTPAPSSIAGAGTRGKANPSQQQGQKQQPTTAAKQGAGGGNQPKKWGGQRGGHGDGTHR